VKSILYKGAHEVAAESKSIPEPGEGEVLIRVAYVGVCGSDMNIYQGVHPRAKAPLVMGHEFSGLIEKVIRPCRKAPRSPPTRCSPAVIANPAGTAMPTSATPCA
jgi:Zn-dependent alcohol dehydrogenases